MRIAGLAVGGALFAAILISLVRAFTAGALQLERVHPGPTVVAFALLIAAYAAQAIAWHKLVQAS